MRIIDSNADIILSSDIIERIEEIESWQDSLIEEYIEANEEATTKSEERTPAERLTNAINELSSFWDITPEEVDDHVTALLDDSDSFKGGIELTELKALADQLQGYGDWYHGAALIRESYFVEYCVELVQDIGDLPKDIPSYLVIDWKATAENLKVDYTEAEYEGVTYYMR